MANERDSKDMYEVRGHLCAGMKEHLAYATYSCIPSFDKYGRIQGCDDTNEIKIKFCPYCGEELQDGPTV